LHLISKYKSIIYWIDNKLNYSIYSILFYDLYLSQLIRELNESHTQEPLVRN
jgi:hypothetical protein